MMQRRKEDILHVQKTRSKGSKAKSLGVGSRLFYHGVDGDFYIINFFGNPLLELRSVG